MKYHQFLLDQMCFLNKRIFNPVILKFAGSAYSPISIIGHVGRRSGVPYTTPVLVKPLADRFMFVLPYGSKVDWYRNILAAGRGTLIWHDKEYPVESPQPLVISTGPLALPFLLKWIVRIVGAQHFIQMKSSGALT